MLLSNGAQMFGGPYRAFQPGATLANSAPNEKGLWNKDGAQRNELAGEAYISGQSDKSSRPSGNLHPVTWKLPQKAGALSSRYFIDGSGTFTGTGALGKNAIAALEGSGTLTATGGLVVSGFANLTGTGSLTGDILAAIQGTATLVGSGSLAGTVAGTGYAAAALSGSGTITGERYAIGILAADITPFTELSPQNLANAVWTQIIESGYSAEEVMRLIASVTAGKSTGGPGSPVFRDLGDTKDRVIGVATSNGDRTSVTYDVTE